MRDWEAVRANADIQFAPVKLPEQPPPPGWLMKLQQWLAEQLAPFAEFLTTHWPVIKWGLIAIAALLALWFLWRLVEPAVRLRRAQRAELEEEWSPDRGEALALLEDADRLAAAGQYDEATHLLLQRSVGQIAAARPGWLEPSSTAREIAGLPALPETARSAFATIADRVERSLFALRRLDVQDWEAARAAYADFALADLATGGAA